MKEFDQLISQFQTGEIKHLPRAVIHLRDLKDPHLLKQHIFLFDQITNLANSIDDSGPTDKRINYYRKAVAAYYVGQTDFIRDNKPIPYYHNPSWNDVYTTENSS